MTDKDERSQLQRRGGRRISIPSSPISPSLPKRHDRFYRSPEVINSIDTHTSGTPVDPPSIEMTFPTALLNNSTMAPSPNGDGESKSATVHMVTTEEQDKSRYGEQLDDTRRTPSSGWPSESRPPQSSRPTYLSDMNTRSSPVVGRISEGRDRYFESAVNAGRNYSTTSLSTDRSASDENTATRVTAMKKSRLNLLNPISLLNRRRSSHNTKLEDMNINVSPLQVPAIPDNFDPSIRGNFVHDFSTPRNKRTHFENSPRRETFSSPTNLRRPTDFGIPGTHHASSPSPALHSPMFREHFQDDDKALQPGQTAYLHNVANSRKPLDAPAPASLPSFAQKLPATLPEPGRVSKEKELPPIIIPHPEAPPPPPPPQLPKSSPSVHLDLPSAPLPKHMTSVSSRFSFQIAGTESSAQEKLLEEKHKEHYAKEGTKSKDEEVIDESYDDYDFDADDDFEERIPGVNTDFDDDGGFVNEDIEVRNIEVQYSQQQPSVPLQPLQPLNNFHFTPTDATFSPTSPYNASEPTPRDVEGFAIGIANSKDSPLGSAFAYIQPKTTDDALPNLFLEGLRISTIDQGSSPLKESVTPLSIPQQAFDDVDLYFDDGEFDMDHFESESHFDESLLDNESGHIRDIPAENARRYEAALERGAPGDRITAIDPNPHAISISRDTSSSSNFVDIRGGGSSGYTSSHEQETSHLSAGNTSGLTEDNLAAYHDALAEAANYAAANGKFNRQISFSSDVSDDVEQSQLRDHQINPTTYATHSQDEATSEYLDDYDTFAFDDDADDDLMIAEANAEALENDDDGFYGQEFGFYARSHSKGTSEYLNGGFFTARGSNGVKRSHSGKANFQEPSLTPITERSEWSTRNSVHGSYQLGAPSPDIAQLLSSPPFEDEMSLNALVKLRRSAFGESSTSINSIGDRSMPGSSPLAHVSNYSFPPIETNHPNKANNGASKGILESEEEDDMDGEQLTLTQNTPRKKIPGASPTNPYGQSAHFLTIESPHASRKSHHRRNSSGADSVSYVQDKDGHWVLERRRTGDDGEQEVVEREYLVGARI